MKKIHLFIALVAIIFASCGEDIFVERYLASATPKVQIYTIDDDVASEATTVIRGRKVVANTGRIVEINEQNFVPITLEPNQVYYVKAESLVEDFQAVAQEGTLWVRTTASIISDRETSQIGGLAKKGESLVITGFDSLRADGTVPRYKVRQNTVEGWVYSKYLTPSKEEAQKRYKAEVYDKIHRAVKNNFGGGEAIGCEFYPTERVSFPNNKMPESCYSLYLNFSPSVIGNIEEYITLAKQTKINTFVLDIKDNECPGYKAEAMKTYSPTNYKYAGSNKEKMYATAVKRLHEEGFYVVARITCFKDSHFVRDHPEIAITERATGEPFRHNKAFWPSAYDRRVWQFNVELAKEVVRKFGFNEVNFDYVRFPDRMNSVENLVDYHNVYNESKVQAIQRFVQYACDEIHAVGAYVSIDVFGEAANSGYTTAYGQYWPAISNICDAICGMPYPDHFTNGYYGISKPWNNPYAILHAWGKRAKARQEETPTPAVVRTWVQAYPVMSHIDKNGIAYNASDVELEIRGLYDAGLTGGYTTWLSTSNIKKYELQEAAFAIDYLQEWRDNVDWRSRREAEEKEKAENSEETKKEDNKE